MLIRRLIDEFFRQDPKVYAAAYERLPKDRFHREFVAIRAALLSKFSPGERVALCLSRDYRYFLTLLACMDVGIVFVPLRMEWPSARVEQIREIAGFGALLTDEWADEAVGGMRPAGLDNVDLPPLSPEQPLYCMFTSGSTGAPKGVLIRRAAYENFLRWTADFFKGISDRDRLLNSTDYTFDVSLAEVALVLTRNVTFYCSRFRDDLFSRS